MRAAWVSACANGSLLAIASAQSKLKAYEISTPLLRLTKEATSLIQEVQIMKERCGSFEMNRTVAGEMIATLLCLTSVPRVYTYR